VLGATPTSSTATEVYTGMQQGTMDAASFPFTYSHVAYKIHGSDRLVHVQLVTRHLGLPAILFSKSAFDALPEQYQKLLMDVRNEAADAQIQAYIDIDKKNIPMLEQQAEEGGLHRRAAGRLPQDGQ
jgi:TRAP-type C4-dicarboxylate transport system substrate-binding protein